MAQYLIKDTTLTGIADAIRSKTGSTDPIVVSDMASQIEGITGGGSGGGSVEGVHYVTFMSEDGTTELYKRAVLDGNDCAEPVDRGFIDTPTKESTAQYDYSFVGWATTPNGAWDENALKAVTEDKTVYAAYASALRYYTITFYDDDGTTVLKSQTLAYGATPSYTPEKEGHQFNGWTPAIVSVTSDAAYTANWIETIASGTMSTGVTWIIKASGEMVFSGSGDMDDYNNSATVNPIPWYNVRDKITKVTISDGVTSIGSYAFSACTKITQISVPTSVTIMGKGFALNCTSLTALSLLHEDFWGGGGYEGWYVGDTRGAKTTSISKDNFMNNVIKYVTSTYVDKWWCR